MATTTVSGRDFDNLYDIGINDYAEKELSTCVYGLTQESFDFWANIAKNGVLFEDNDTYTMNDGVSDSWVVDNYEYNVVTCGNKIYHKDDWWNFFDFRQGANYLDDDYNEIFLVLKAMETREEGHVPGIAWWDPYLVMGSRNFAEPSKLLRSYPELRGEIASQVAILADQQFSSKQETASKIFEIMRAAGASYDTDNMVFYTPWREVDGKSNADDWVTPLIRAGAIVDMMQEYIMVQSDILFENLERGDWYVNIDQGSGTLYIVTGEQEQIEVTDYFNDRIWRKEGEERETVKTALLSEIEEAVTRSKERCYNCVNVEQFSIDLQDQIAKLLAYLAINEETMNRLKSYASPASLEKCCHEEPPRLFDEATKQCTELTAAQICFSSQQPAFFDPETCACEQQSAAMRCYNMEPPGHYIFTYDPQTMEGSCVECSAPTPLTKDGTTCVGQTHKEPSQASQCLNTPVKGTWVVSASGVGCEPCPEGKTTKTGKRGSCTGGVEPEKKEPEKEKKPPPCTHAPTSAEQGKMQTLNGKALDDYVSERHICI